MTSRAAVIAIFGLVGCATNPNLGVLKRQQPLQVR
jgi:hypothetical protein